MYFVYFQVKTGLLNPTKYHVQQSQRRQVHMYLNNSEDVSAAQSLPGLTTLTTETVPSNNAFSLGNNVTTVGSAPTHHQQQDPGSPISIGMSSATGSVSEVRIYER